MHTDSFGEMVAHPAAGLDVRLARRFDSVARQPEPLSQPFPIGAALMMGCPIRATAISSVALQRPPQPKDRLPVPLQRPTCPLIAEVQFQPDH
jgi:hypothetical protein